MDNGQKTPRGHSDFNSYVKILRVFIFRTDRQIFLIHTLLLHIPLLALTHRRNYGETNTPAARGLEELFSVVLERFIVPYPFKLCPCIARIRLEIHGNIE